MMQAGDFGIVPLAEAPDGFGGGWRNCWGGGWRSCFNCANCFSCANCFNCRSCFGCHNCWGGWGRGW